jgi:acyl-CoA thioesterase-1
MQTRRWLFKVTKLGRVTLRSYGGNGRRVQSAPIAAALVFCAALLSALAPAAQAADNIVKIVALGDSLTAGYGLPGEDAFPAQLERALKEKGHRVEIQNAGVSGDTASGGLSRLGWAVPDGTDAVILELGANDMLRGVDPKVTREALEQIIRKLKSRNIDVLLCGMQAARNMGEDYRKRFDAIYPELAKEHDLVFYPFFLDGVATQTKMSLDDGLHPNAAGVAHIVSSIEPKVEELLARVRNKNGS